MSSHQDTDLSGQKGFLCETKNCKVTDDSLAHLNHWRSLVKKFIQTQLRKIYKERNRATLIIPLHNKEREILFYSSAPGCNPHCSCPAGLLSPAGQRDAQEPALGPQVTTETIFRFNSTIFFYCYNFGWNGKLVMSTSFFWKIAFHIKIRTRPNLLICQRARLLIYQKYIKGVSLIYIFLKLITNELFYLP